MPEVKTYQSAIKPDVMRLIQQFVDIVIANQEPNQIIRRSGDPYILRYMLSRKSWIPIYDDPNEDMWKDGGMASMLENLYIHQYNRGDEDEPHCHPWPNATLVVRGEYTEDVYEEDVHVGRFIRRTGDVVLRTAKSVHAIVHTSPDCISLFATMRKEKDWGFHTAEGYVPHELMHSNNASKV
jgi:hypothetical protein